AAAGYDMFRWGPGRRGTLLLSDAAGSMGFLSFAHTLLGRVTATALSGQISRADRKFLAAHRIEAAVSPRLTIGIAEAVRYPSDGVDLLYASGLIPYAIVERIHIRDADTDSVRGAERPKIARCPTGSPIRPASGASAPTAPGPSACSASTRASAVSRMPWITVRTSFIAAARWDSRSAPTWRTCSWKRAMSCRATGAFAGRATSRIEARDGWATHGLPRSAPCRTRA